MELQRNVTLGQYIDADSFLHRLDPRVKFFMLMGMMGLVLWVRHPLAFSCLLLVVLVGPLFGRIPMGYYLGGLRPVLPLVVISMLVNLFLIHGTVIASWGFLHVTREGATLAYLVLFRVTILVLATTLVTLTTSPIRLTDGLERMGAPLHRIGVPVHELALMVSIALRFIPILAELAEKLMKAQMSRGAEVDHPNLLRRIRALVPVLVPLFVQAFKAADELALAMEARCYRGGSGRTRLKRLQLTARDAVAAFLVALGAGGLVFGELQVWGHTLPW